MGDWNLLSGKNKFILFGEGIWNRTAPFVYLANPELDSISIGGTNASAGNKADVIGNLNVTENIYENNFLLSATYLGILDINDYVNWTDGNATYMDRNDWTSIDDYPANCNAGEYVYEWIILMWLC